MVGEQQSKQTESELAALKEILEQKLGSIVESNKAMAVQLNYRFDAHEEAHKALATQSDLKSDAIYAAIAALDIRLQTATTVQAEKVLIATSALNQRLEEMMNQIHALETNTTLNRNVYLTQAEHIAWKNQIDSQLSTLHDFEIIMRTKASNSAVVVSYIMTGVLFVISIINISITIADKIFNK